LVEHSGVGFLSQFIAQLTHDLIFHLTHHVVDGHFLLVVLHGIVHYVMDHAPSNVHLIHRALELRHHAVDLLDVDTLGLLEEDRVDLLDLVHELKNFSWVVGKCYLLVVGVGLDLGRHDVHSCGHFEHLHGLFGLVRRQTEVESGAFLIAFLEGGFGLLHMFLLLLFRPLRLHAELFGGHLHLKDRIHDVEFLLGCGFGLLLSHCIGGFSFV